MRIFIPILILLFASCSSVKNVLNDPKKFQRVADSVVARGYCVNDTIVQFKILEKVDTSEYEVETIIDGTPCPDFTKIKGKATVTSVGGKLIIKDTCVEKIKTITMVRTEVVRDRKREEILEKTIASQADKISKQAKRLNQMWKWLIAALVAGFVIGTIRKLFR